MSESLIGVFEIAEMANVSASAVANWRKRFPDFPAPLAELKSGEIAPTGSVFAWPVSSVPSLRPLRAICWQLA